MKSFLWMMFLVLTLFALSQVVTAPRASADMTGGCVATVGGANANDIDTPGTALDVDFAQDVPVTMTSPVGLASHRVEMEWTGLRWAVSSGTDNGVDTSWNDTVAVSDYAKYGVGIYKVWAVAEMVGGTECEGEIYVNVTNASALSTPAGIAAAAAAAAGVAALAAAAAAAAVAQANAAAYAAFLAQQSTPGPLEPSEPGGTCCTVSMLPALLLTVAAMTTGGGGMKPASTPASANSPANPKMKFRPRLSVLGIGGGFIGSVGGLIYMQQSGSVYPTLPTTILSVVVGLGLGVGIPTLIQSFGIKLGKGKVKKK